MEGAQFCAEPGRLGKYWLEKSRQKGTFRGSLKLSTLLPKTENNSLPLFQGAFLRVFFAIPLLLPAEWNSTLLSFREQYLLPGTFLQSLLLFDACLVQAPAHDLAFLQPIGRSCSRAFSPRFAPVLPTASRRRLCF